MPDDDFSNTALASSHSVRSFTEQRGVIKILKNDREQLTFFDICVARIAQRFAGLVSSPCMGNEAGM